MQWQPRHKNDWHQRGVALVPGGQIDGSATVNAKYQPQRVSHVGHAARMGQCVSDETKRVGFASITQTLVPLGLM